MQAVALSAWLVVVLLLFSVVVVVVFASVSGRDDIDETEHQFSQALSAEGRAGHLEGEGNREITSLHIIVPSLSTPSHLSLTSHLPLTSLPTTSVHTTKQV